MTATVTTLTSSPWRRPRSRSDLPGLEEVVVLGLAASRFTRAVSLDEISAPLRRRIEQRAAGGGTLATWADKLVGCPLCVGWWASLAVSMVAPGRHRLLRGLSVAGVQTLLALAERLVSEEGRAAIHEADVVEAQASEQARRSPAR